MPQTDPATAATINVVTRYSDAFNNGDVDGVMAAMTDDCVVETPMPPPDGAKFIGQDAVRALWNEFFQSSASFRFDTEDMFATGDQCLVRWIFHWVGHDDQPGHVRGVDLFKVRDGKVAEKLVYVKG
ncbi:MAG: nuclear transport factor 2 family protein [SAR202 cluster bacterium]|nr:nuclear transport factor 2 family protein [SAR202 cluster bacterium]